MRGLRLLLPIVFAVLFAAAGVVRVLPPAAAGAPPCHMMEMGASHAPTPKPPVDMACCTACLAPAPQLEVIAARSMDVTARIVPPVMLTPPSRSPTPEPDPPRNFA